MTHADNIHEAFYREVGRQVSVYRTRKRMSRCALASEIGVHRNTLTRWERGLQPVPMLELLRIADIVQVNLIMLLPMPEFVWREQPATAPPSVLFPPRKPVHRVTFSQLQRERDPALTTRERRMA